METRTVVPNGSLRSNLSFTSRLATTPTDSLAAFRLRYEVYIEEQGKAYPDANHDERLLWDELDANGDVIVVATSDDLVIGTVRANWFNSLSTQTRYGHVFQIQRFTQIECDAMAVCSRLVVSSEHRHGMVRQLLIDSVYQRGLERGTILCFAACTRLMLRVFRKYGFREYAAPIFDPVVGSLYLTLLVLDDLDHLELVNSPFLSIARARRLQTERRPWLSRLFDDYKEQYATR